jgi:predicted amidophosphoribosyltransferase
MTGFPTQLQTATGTASSQAAATNRFAIASLATFVIVLCLFVAVLVARGQVKDFKRSKSKAERRISDLFKNDAGTCNHCGNDLPESDRTLTTCPQCGEEPYELPALIKSRELVEKLVGGDRCPHCNEDLSNVSGNTCPNCSRRSDSVVQAFDDTICANPRCDYNLKRAQDDGPVDRCPACNTPHPYRRDLIGGFNDTICDNCTYNLKPEQGEGRVDECPNCGTRNPYGGRA